MSALAKVLDLLDDRCLNLPDVVGKPEPLPVLVPFDEYDKNVVVYRTDTAHEVTMGIIQELTVRAALETGEELWTWCAQWEVSGSPASRLSRPVKKPRVDLFQAVAQAKQRQASVAPILERRVLDPALMKEENMLRILIDIVQVDSSLVPNFIEFLYRWVDFYEGDGMALKAALKCEIPSLWDFEFHPLLLPASMRKTASVELDDSESSNNVGRTDKPFARSEKEEELAQSSPTKKMRSKPNLAAIERQALHAEESERLQYREVRYGIQPPRLKQRLPPLINIPQDPQKRIKYYAACFKSRHRALYLLQEAGITVRQIANYVKLQTEHPQQTCDAPGGRGMRHYEKDMEFAQKRFEAREQFTKQREIAISNKLAVEALLAARTAAAAASDGASGAPLIPPTPSYQHARRPDVAAAMISRMQAARKVRPERIAAVPMPLVGRMRSQLFEGAQGVETGQRRKVVVESDSDGEDFDSESELIESDSETESVDDGSGFASTPSVSFLPPPGGPPVFRPPPLAINSSPGQTATGSPQPIQNQPPPTPHSGPAPATGTGTAAVQHHPALPPPPRPFLPPPRPPPLPIRPSLCPPSAPKTLIQIYLPSLIAPRRAGTAATDVLVLGHTDATASTLVLTHALYLPVTLRMMQRVKEGRAAVLEAYAAGSTPHRALLEKMKGVCGFVGLSEGEGEEGREARVTKRWRAGKASVWEGYGVVIDRGVDMHMWERDGRVCFRTPQ